MIHDKSCQGAINLEIIFFTVDSGVEANLKALMFERILDS